MAPRSPAAASVLLLLCALAAAGCRTPARPAPPRPLTGLRDRPDERALLPYLEAYPLGEQATREDRLGRDRERSVHLVQTRGVIRPHYHARHTEKAYVLRGRGTVYVDGRSYPAVPGSAFRLDPGVVHSVHPDAGETLVAVVHYEPPLDVEDRVPVTDSAPGPAK